MNKKIQSPFEQMEYISMETWPNVPSNIVRLLAAQCCQSYEWKGKPKSVIIRAFKSKPALIHFGNMWTEHNTMNMFKFDPIRHPMNSTRFINLMDMSQQMYKDVDTNIRKTILS